MTGKDLHPHYNVAIHQLTTPRTMQAYLVVIFSTTIVMMTAVNQPIPDIISYGLAAILGFYFKDASTEVVPTVIPNGSSVEKVSRVLEAEMAMDSLAYERMLREAARPPTGTGPLTGTGDDETDEKPADSNSLD